MRTPQSHPRYQSLRTRELLVGGFNAGAVTTEGIIAHGRGEAFDYIIGETSAPHAQKAAHAAAAALLLAKSPVISVNGNVAALCPEGIVKLAASTSALLEVNLFYDSPERRRVIAGILLRHGAKSVLGADEDRVAITGLESARRLVSPDGIAAADVVLVPLEDGDRTMALRNLEKRVITIDLNPLSRTARTAHITIVDNLIRAIPLLAYYCSRMKEYDQVTLKSIVKQFDNAANLRDCIQHIKKRLEEVEYA